MEIEKYKNFIRISKELDNVLTLSDLRIIFNKSSQATFYREVKELIVNKELIKIKTGLYATKDADLKKIAHRIDNKSYLSMGIVLSNNGIIGSIPSRKIQFIRVGVPKKYTFISGNIEFLSISKKLFFGFKKKGAINIASTEKAFLDSCYFYYKRKTFSFNLFSDIDFKLLKFTLIKTYLKEYDQRFITYFYKNWGESFEAK